MDLADLRRLPTPELIALATGLQLPLAPNIRRGELLYRIARATIDQGTPLTGDGVLEITPQHHGFLRSADESYHASPADVQVHQSIIKRLALRTGDTVRGPVRVPRPQDKQLSLAEVESVNGLPAAALHGRGSFDVLRPLYPDQRLRLERRDGNLSMRVVDLMAPIGKGQRGLIVAPPRAGKTILLHQMANAITENHPEATLIVLLIDERPEEVTDFKATVPRAEVVASTFDETPKRHVAVAAMVLERAKRLVEAGRDVVILLDSITRLARAHNNVTPMSGKILSGGVDAKALEKPKRFFGAARRIDGGGSLTIVATALVSTGSRMDEVIFEEFKGTGNMELVLDRDIANRRIFPAIDIFKSGTRKEELLLTDEEKNRIFLIRHFVGSMPPDEAIDFILKRMKTTPDNRAFFKAMVEGA
ncbi:MAG: transcription termination factor Rho [Gemmatimonadaceae bacterium]|nr:transcription termination factor Rho [Gemmatimonadaceae bacterium]